MTLSNAIRQLGLKLQKRLVNKAIISVFVIVAAWNVAVSFDWSKKYIPLAIRSQLRFYTLLWSWQPVPRYVTTVSVVRIDDSLHWSQSICDSPTSRHLLAQL